MARQKLPDRFICIEDRERSGLRYRVHFVSGGRRVARGYGTAEEAEAFRDKVIRATAHLKTASVRDAVEDYFEDMVARGKWRREARTYTSKTGIVRRFLEPIADLPVGSISQNHIDRCCKEWDGPTRTAQWTRRLGRVRARAFFTWALGKRMVKAHPMGEDHVVPKPTEQLPGLGLDDSRRLRAVVDPAAARGDQRATFVLAALLLGARTSELQSLTRRSFDDKGRVVSYRDAKKPSKVHRVRMPAVLHEPMRLLAERAGDRKLFPSRTAGGDGTWGARAVRHWARVAGLEMADEMDVRWLRRTKDTLAVEAGVSSEVVARETGHSLHVARTHYIQHGAETSARAAAMEEATGTSNFGTSTRAAKDAK